MENDKKKFHIYEFMTLIDNLPYSAWIKDDKCRFIKANKAYIKTFGLRSPEQLRGKTISEFLEIDEVNKYHAQDFEILKTGKIIKSREKIARNGRAYYYEITKGPLKDEKRKVIGVYGIARDVTEQVEYQNELKKSKIKFENLFKDISDGVIISIENKIQLANKAFAKMLGYTNGEILGKDLDFFTNKEEIVNITARVSQRLRGQISKGTFQTYAFKKNGVKVELEMVEKKIEYEGRLASQIIVRDITGKKKVESALRESEERYRVLIEALRNSVIVLNKKGRIIFANTAFCKLVGRKKSEITNKAKIDQFIHPNDYNKEICLTEKMRLSVKRIIHRSGEIRYVECYGQLQKENDANVGLRVVMRDVTEKKILEEKVEEKTYYHQLVSDLSYKSLQHKKIESFLSNSVRMIGEKTGVDRVCMLEINKYHRNIKLNHFWKKSGISGNEHMINDYSINDFSELLNHFASKGYICINDVDKEGSKNAKKLLNVFSTKSFLAIPIKTSDRIYGFISLEYTTKPFFWGDMQIKFMRIISNIIGQTLDRKILQDKIIQSKNHYAQVIDAIQDSICVVDVNLKIASHNKSFARKVRLHIKKIKGRDCREVIPRFVNNLFKNMCGRNKCKENCFLVKVFKTGRATQFLEESKDGNKTYYHRVSIFPTKNRRGEVKFAVFSIRDVTRRMGSEEEYRRLSELNKRIIDNIPVSIITFDKKGSITFMNKYFMKISGRKLDEHSTIFDSEFNKTYGLINQYKRLLKNGEIARANNCRYYGVSKEMGKKYINVMGVPLYDKNGSITGGVSMQVNVTEAVEAKRKLEELNKNLERMVKIRTNQLNVANEELSNVLSLKTNFMADASHELRTPLTIIRGNLDLITDEVIKNNAEEVVESKKIIMREVEAITNILNDLMTLTRVESETRSDLSFEKINLYSIANTVAQSLGVIAKEKGVRVDLNGDKKVLISGSYVWIEKLIKNLIYNAIKYSKKKGGYVKVIISLHDEKVLLSVKDNGIGIPKKEISHVFERFYRVEKSRSRAEGGTGLGLSICKWVAEVHGGRIELKSKLGRGSEFIVTFPPF